MTYKKKLIEVALPLDAIDKAAQDENNTHTGLPANLHTWWSRKPLGVARAVIFSSLVDDPGEHLPDEQAAIERERLFSIVEQLADVKAGGDDKLLESARCEINQSNREGLPTFWDPFCGGGSLPLEALRLGLRSIATDINPVAVLLTRILISLAPAQAYHSATSPTTHARLFQSEGRFEGLKRDVEYYAERIHSRLEERLGRYYPAADLPQEVGGGKGQVAAWVWARTVTCPNPSCRARSPLVNKFLLSTHVGNEAYVAPIYNPLSRSFTYSVRKSGQATNGTVNRSGATCLACAQPISFDHVRSEGVAGRISYDLMALAVEGPHGRLYLKPTADQIAAAQECEPDWEPDAELPDSALGFRVQRYGITEHRHLFTKRQMTALSCLAEIISATRQEVTSNAGGDLLYADLIMSFLGLSLSRVAQTNNTLVRWLVRRSGTSKGTPAFDRQIVSMVWEFSEGNILGGSVGSWRTAIKNPLTALASVPASHVVGEAIQHNASDPWKRGGNYMISTDPPYFDAIGYADLSDFFYVWLRRALQPIHPDIFETVLVPKDADFTRDLGRTTVSRHVATQSFLEQLQEAFKNMRMVCADDVPLTVYYAFKQAEMPSMSDARGEPSVPSTGWDTLLESLISSGFRITGTWPLRTESASRLRAIGSNALASSIILVCRKRPVDAPTATRREFVTALKTELPIALAHLQRANIAPVDLAQAAIGPGMAVYTRYAKVLDAAGNPVPVREALALINQTLDEALAEQEGDFDADSRWALAWFEQSGFAEGEYGVAETLSKAKNTSVAGMVDAGILVSSRGKVRLLRPNEMQANWDPAKDRRLTAWESVHQLIRALETGGEAGAADLAARLGSQAETARELAYRLYTICERKKRAAEALWYNGLVQSWPEIARLAADARQTMPMQPDLFAAREGAGP